MPKQRLFFLTYAAPLHKTFLPQAFSIIIFETKLLVHKAKNKINAHKNLGGLILDICEGQTKFIIEYSKFISHKNSIITHMYYTSHQFN